jgi:hypothetical protein
MSISTSAKLPSEAMKTSNHPGRKVLKIADMAFNKAVHSRKSFKLTSSCNLVQVNSQPTRVVTNSTGRKSSIFIDHIFTNAAEICLKAASRSIGCSDHNIVAISRKTQVPKAGPVTP